MNNQTVLVLDFGGQYNQLIARRVRECGVYCEVFPYNKGLAAAKEKKPVGIIFTGGPNSVYDENSPQIEREIFELGIPVLGICYGAQLMAQTLGGKVSTAEVREYGKSETFFKTDSLLFDGLPSRAITWMSHGDYISVLPEGFGIIANTSICPVAAMENIGNKLYAM
ncbi:MAG: glutamine-hydrolyzing GMP synthase, partial [Bacillota bacterium]|nr:glutamine-hydrolyzing GMP synthase [Bacillota bacterium]